MRVFELGPDHVDPGLSDVVPGVREIAAHVLEGTLADLGLGLGEPAIPNSEIGGSAGLCVVAHRSAVRSN